MLELSESSASYLQLLPCDHEGDAIIVLKILHAGCTFKILGMYIKAVSGPR